MRIARLLIYEGTKEALDAHFQAAGVYVRPGEVRVGNGHGRSGDPFEVKVSEDPATGAGGRVELEPGEVAAIKVIK